MSIDLGDIMKREEARQLERMFNEAGVTFWDSPFWEKTLEHQRSVMVICYMLGQMSSVLGPDRMTALVKLVADAWKPDYGTTAPPPEAVVRSRVCQRPASCGQPYCSCREAAPPPEMPEAVHGT